MLDLPTPTQPASDLIDDDPAARFVGIWANYGLKNRWLTVVAVVFGCTTLLSAGGLVYLATQMSEQRPLIVRVDSVGRAQAIDYTGEDTFTPTESEIWYFLQQYARLHHGRRRETVRQDWLDSLLFLDPRRVTALTRTGQKTPVEEFLADPLADEVDVEVVNVVPRPNLDPSREPSRAQIDYIAKHYRPGSRQVAETQTFTEEVVYRRLKRPALAMRSVNPLGFQILDASRSPQRVASTTGGTDVTR